MSEDRTLAVTVHKLDRGARVAIAAPGQPPDWVRFDSMSEANTAAEIIEERLSPDAEPCTFEEFASVWFERHVMAECGQRTQSQYHSKLKNLVHYFGSTLLTDISHSMVRSYYDSLRPTKGVKPRNAMLTFLRQVLNRAKDWRFIAINPADSVDEDDLMGASPRGRAASHD